MSERHYRALQPPIISEAAAVESSAASCQKGREAVAPRVAAAAVVAEAAGFDSLSAPAGFPEFPMLRLPDYQS